MNATRRALFGFVFVLCFIGHARAQLTGATVNVSTFFPDSTSVWSDPGNAVVSGAIEYPVGSYFFYNSTFEVDINDNQVVITDVNGVSDEFSAADFNGFILRVVSGPGITGASVDSSSDFFPVSLSVEGGNKVLINFQGLIQDLSPGASSIINLTVVPEPAMCSVMSFIVLSLLRRR